MLVNGCINWNRLGQQIASGKLAVQSIGADALQVGWWHRKDSATLRHKHFFNPLPDHRKALGKWCNCKIVESVARFFVHQTQAGRAGAAIHQCNGGEDLRRR